MSEIRHNTQNPGPFPGADELTPSRSQYFSWINNTNEGATEEHTRVNLRFFEWLRQTYGMQLDIYAFDAGAVDGCNIYGSQHSEYFSRHFPNGFGPLAKEAAALGTRLGLWGGPDGFGDTPEAEAARIEEMVSLCREHHFVLFKMDSVCGQLRPEKYDAFDRMMTECRRYSPDLILLNHRLDLGPGTRHSTTFLLGGAETYIDAQMPNTMTASHHRAGALARELPPNLTRLTEDHGVCLSSCLDYWEDDLILQAFNRSLILAPELYGNPWLLRDDEYPRLADIFNLHRRFREILVRGMILPESEYGPLAVSRGDGTTRLLTLRNLEWESSSRTLRLDQSIGLDASGADAVEIHVTLLHPWREALGAFAYGSSLEVEVLPFRACLVLVTSKPVLDWSIEGCAYQVIRDTPEADLEVELLGSPGTSAELRWKGEASGFRVAELDGEGIAELLEGKSLAVDFAGPKRQRDWHRKLATLQPIEVPDDAEALYEATCFAADNDAFEYRSLRRSGPTKIPAVQAARDAFFDQTILRERENHAQALFDGNPRTAFSVDQRWWETRVKNGAFRLDLGEVQTVDELVLTSTDAFSLQPLKPDEGVTALLSADLRNWKEVRFRAGRRMVIPLKDFGPWRYLKFAPTPLRLNEIIGFRDGQRLDSSAWRASNLLAPWDPTNWRVHLRHSAHAAWSAKVMIEEVLPGSYLCVAIDGVCGPEGAVAGFRFEGRYLGCPDRSPSFPCNAWEVPAQIVDRNYTYYLPLTEEMAGKELEVVALAFDSEKTDLRPEVWQTAYPIPFSTKRLVLRR